jgi:hypothetical protein
VFSTVFTALLGNVYQQLTFLCFRAHVLAGCWRSHINLQDKIKVTLQLVVSQSVSQLFLVSRPTWGPRPDFCYCKTVTGLLMWSALSDERMVLSFGLRQGSHSQVRVPWDTQPYFTVSDSKLPFSSPPTTRRVTMEVFDPTSTRDIFCYCPLTFLILHLHVPRRKHFQYFFCSWVRACCGGHVMATEPLPSNCRVWRAVPK